MRYDLSGSAGPLATCDEKFEFLGVDAELATPESCSSAIVPSADLVVRLWLLSILHYESDLNDPQRVHAHLHQPSRVLSILRSESIQRILMSRTNSVTRSWFSGGQGSNTGTPSAAPA